MFSEDGEKANDVRNSPKMGESLPKGELQQGRILYWQTSTWMEVPSRAEVLALEGSSSILQTKAAGDLK